MRTQMCRDITEKVALILIGFSLTYLGWYIIVLVISVLFLLWKKDNKKIKFDKEKNLEVLKNLKEIPSWVMFPDTERAEWLNEIFIQMWPTISSYIINKLRVSLQNKIRKKFGSFTFEDIDLGRVPPKVEGVQVFKSYRVKDSIVIDFDIFYDGDCNVKFSYSGAHGGIKEFQLKVLARLVFKPLVTKLPFMGGVQIFFLNQPEFDFDLYGITGIPGLSYFITQTIQHKLSKLIVFPNKYTIKFSKLVNAAELKSIQPEGVLRVHVFEARNLIRKDVTGKSDPYVTLYVGAQERKTQVVKRSLDPKWDYWCEFYILDPASQILGLKIYDDDEFNEDDFLGSAEVDIKTIIKENKTDQWLKLEKAEQGEIHLRFTWLSLSPDYENLKTALAETKSLQAPVNTCLLMVYIDSANTLPMVKSFKKPHPFLTLTVDGKTTEKTKVRKYTVNPTWEQGFIFFVKNPETDVLHMTITDRQTDEVFEKLDYELSKLCDYPDLEISKVVLDMENGGKLIISLQLRILVSESAFPESDSDSDDDFFDQPALKLMTEEKAKSLQQANLGQIQLTIDYSVVRQNLIVTVHKITDLLVKDLNDLPDAYVTIELSNHGSPSKKRTRIAKDSANPVFEQKFDFSVPVEEVVKQNLVVFVKNKKKYFFSQPPIIGGVVVPLNDVVMKEQTKSWYKLTAAN